MATMNKRGVFFTLLSITFVSILLLNVTPPLPQYLDQDTKHIRVKQIDELITQFEQGYLPLALRSAAAQATRATTLHLNTTATFLTNPEEELANITHRGTVGSQIILVNNTLQNFTKSYEELIAKTFFIEVNVTSRAVSIHQINPWQLELSANASITIISEVGNWSKNATTKTSLPIIGFIDPHTLLYSTGRTYAVPIHRSTLLSNQWNLSNFEDFIESGNFTRREGSNAPSFLERFKSTPLASECCGIETIVDPTRLPSQEQKSYIDFNFWTGTALVCDGNPQDLYHVFPLGHQYREVKLSFGEAIVYNVSGGAQEVCP